MYNIIFYTNILRLMEEQGMTRRRLSERTGVSISFLSELTNGKANPSLKTMESIATELGVPLPALLEMSDLDEASLLELSGGHAVTGLPSGYQRVTCVLTNYQAYMALQWDKSNREKIKRT